MARGTNTDFATTLGMLHTAVTNTGNDLRDVIGKSVEKLEASGQAAQQGTTRAVVDELGRMRTNLREARDRLSAGGEMLNAEVRQAVTQLQVEMRDVRASVENITSAAPTPANTTTPAHPDEPVAHDSSGLFGTAPEPAPEAAEHNGFPAEPARPPVAAQRDGSEAESAASAGPPVEMVQQAVRDVLVQELAPLSSLLAERTDRQSDGFTALGDDVRAHLRATVGDLRELLDAARQETHAQLAALREEVAGLRAGLEQLQPSDNDDPAPEVTAEHSKLLKQAARVSSVDLLCHGDIWEFITAQAGRHPHFRVPPQAADDGAERIRAALSGRSLIALLISLHSVVHTAKDGDGDRELATTLYERIRASLNDLAPLGQPVTITLDDRSFPSPDVQPADATPGSTREPITDPPVPDGDRINRNRQGPSAQDTDDHDSS